MARAGVRMDGIIKNFLLLSFKDVQQWSKETYQDTQSMTGKSLALKANDRQMGWKKILVLRSRSANTHARTKWVMHQYHLGDIENVKE